METTGIIEVMVRSKPYTKKPSRSRQHLAPVKYATRLRCEAERTRR